MMRKHITTKEMVKKLLYVIENRIEKNKDKAGVLRRNLETTL